MENKVPNNHMADATPFKGGGFLGTLEVQGKLDCFSKQLRIQRIKEVREQEKAIAQQRCVSYRQCIYERKADKECHLKKQKQNDQLHELNNLHSRWQRAASESGGAHRSAKENVNILMKKTAAEACLLQKREKEKVRRENDALKLRHEQILETQRQSLRLLELQQVKKEIRQSDREDAHAMGEVYAARQELLDLKNAALSGLHRVPKVYTQTRVQQGADSIEQRFAVEVNARIWRHGARATDSTVIRNGASVEETAILKKNWQLVMREMQNRTRTRVRARTAYQTVERQKGVQFLDSELQQLEAADKAHGRQFRLCNSTAVVPDVEEPRLQNTFEKMFLSKPVRLDHHQHQHALYRTGTHLAKASLDNLLGEDRYLQETDFSERAAAANGYHCPTWTSSYAATTATDLFYPKSSDNSSLDGSSMVSEELHVLHQQDDRMYWSLDEPIISTAADIPMASRPPPSWSAVVPQLTSAPPVSAPVTGVAGAAPNVQHASTSELPASKAQSISVGARASREGAPPVRIPQVPPQQQTRDAMGTGVPSKTAHWAVPSSSASASTSSSSLDEVSTGVFSRRTEFLLDVIVFHYCFCSERKRAEHFWRWFQHLRGRPVRSTTHHQHCRGAGCPPRGSEHSAQTHQQPWCFLHCCRRYNWWAPCHRSVHAS